MDRRVHVSLGISCGAESDAYWAKVVRQGLVTPSQTHRCSCHRKWPHVSNRISQAGIGSDPCLSSTGVGKKKRVEQRIKFATW